MADDCENCESAPPELSENEDIIFEVYQDIQRWGFSKDVFEVYGLKPTRLVLEKLSIIDEIVRKKREKEEEDGGSQN